jgi:chemotaxis protein methyltransferase CheR
VGGVLSDGASVKEFLFTQADFDRVRQLIYARAGISLGDGKHEMVYSRLARRLRALGLTTCTAYLQLLADQVNAPEWEFFTNALTTNLTAFFREAHHFPILAAHVRQKKAPIVLWTCASSTGEEPYSMAIAACEAFDSLTPPVSILATDIDTQVLETAGAGIYPLSRVNGLSEERLQRYFLRGRGEQSGFVRIRPEIRNMVIFKRLNLLSDDWGISTQIDAIFCRNVMIYFDKLTQGNILRRFVPLLKADGLLFSGHSENLAFVTDRFILKGKTVYELSQRYGV